MSYLSVSLKLALRDRLRGWRPWAALVLALAAVLWCRGSAAAGGLSRGPVLVGLAAGPQPEAQEFCERIEEHSGPGIRFCRCGEDTLRRRVASGRWDCGLVLPGDFGTRLERPSAREAVTLITGPGSAADPLVRETASAVLAGMLAPRIAEDYLLSAGAADPASLEALRPRLKKPLPPGQEVSIRAETPDGTPLTLPEVRDRTLEQILLSALAALTLVWALSLAGELGRWRGTPAALGLARVRGETALLLPRLLAGLLPVWILEGAVLLAAFGAESLRFATVLPLYLAVLGGLDLLLARRPALWRDILPAAVPFAAAAGFVLSPVFLDAAPLPRSLAAAAELLPSTLFLRAGGGSVPALICLAAMAAAAAAAAAAAVRNDR